MVKVQPWCDALRRMERRVREMCRYSNSRIPRGSGENQSRGYPACGHGKIPWLYASFSESGCKSPPTATMPSGDASAGSGKRRIGIRSPRDYHVCMRILVLKKEVTVACCKQWRGTATLVSSSPSFALDESSGCGRQFWPAHGARLGL